VRPSTSLHADLADTAATRERARAFSSGASTRGERRPIRTPINTPRVLIARPQPPPPLSLPLSRARARARYDPPHPRRGRRNPARPRSPRFDREIETASRESISLRDARLSRRSESPSPPPPPRSRGGSDRVAKSAGEPTRDREETRRDLRAPTGGSCINARRGHLQPVQVHNRPSTASEEIIVNSVTCRSRRTPALSPSLSFCIYIYIHIYISVSFPRANSDIEFWDLLARQGTPESRVMLKPCLVRIPPPSLSRPSPRRSSLVSRSGSEDQSARVHSSRKKRNEISGVPVPLSVPVGIIRARG